ncbi:MAG TPA: aromatic ring-hydroxylating dioxygenase subunit alpha [Vicinamibacterales bacterium]|nr:aromatic ring-hydroxylating dioxygenase subunit alpha [Vicinamibacterales bacterium]
MPDDTRLPRGKGFIQPAPKPLTLDEITAGDKGEKPLLLRDAGDVTPAPRLIPYDRYLDQKFVDLELEKIWKTQWQMACREEDIPNVGDRTIYEVATLSFVVVRKGPNEFAAFYNSCRHRGRKLCTKKDSGGNVLRCPFHGWEYGLDGRLSYVPLNQEFPHVDAHSSSLVPVRVGTWGGHVFINPDPAATPLEDALGVLIDHFKDFPLEDRQTAILIRLKIRANWKAAQEAFLEAYHTVETHADGMPILGSASTQIDVWSKGRALVSRLYTPVAVVDDYIAKSVSPRDGLELYCRMNDFDKPPKDRGHDLADARLYAAERQAKRLKKDTKRDFSNLPTSYLVDAPKYHMFPAFHPWWGEGIPWWYNFTPLGDDPDQCVMEIRILQPVPANGVRQPVPPAITLEFGEEPDKHPILSKTFVGPILAQDLRNMEGVQQGFKAAAPGHRYMTVARYQEAQITHFHEIYDRVMGLSVDRSAD